MKFKFTKKVGTFDKPAYHFAHAELLDWQAFSSSFDQPTPGNPLKPSSNSISSELRPS